MEEYEINKVQGGYSLSVNGETIISNKRYVHEILAIIANMMDEDGATPTTMDDISPPLPRLHHQMQHSVQTGK
ncbi:MAG: hypothetical protein HQL69_19185 [Magnetococcales bacterium]|nr:hypothetical protein [Magnetococcales bacterium]